MTGVKKITSVLLATTILFTSGVATLAAEVPVVTIDQAVEHGIENSKTLDEVELEIELARNTKNRGSFKARKLERSNKDIKDGIKAINTAQGMIDQGILPQDVTTPDGNTIKAGTDITTLDPGSQAAIKDGVNKSLNDSRNQIDKGDTAIADALEQAGSSIGGVIDFSSLNAFDIDSTAEMLELMPSVAFEVTQASFDIYKNGIALLIQKSYYDVLQAQELLKTKERAMKRGAKQYEFAKAAYEEGIKAKDDVLMAEVYYKTTKVAYEKVKGDLESSLVELKKNASYDMSKDIQLTSIMLSKPETFDLDQGLKMGMENRLEMKKTAGEVIVYTTNFSETKKSYTPNTFQYKEAELLQKKSFVKYQQAQTEVEGSIRKSYELMKSTTDMLNQTQGMVANAKENLEIADYKYKEGFGVNTSMLSSMNLQDSAGTIIEVLAAEEKLAEIEENVVKITYAYNLSRMQYKNNIGDFVY